jgi:hypothetical protein
MKLSAAQRAAILARSLPTASLVRLGAAGGASSSSPRWAVVEHESHAPAAARWRGRLVHHVDLDVLDPERGLEPRVWWEGSEVHGPRRRDVVSALRVLAGGGGGGGHG